MLGLTQRRPLSLKPPRKFLSPGRCLAVAILFKPTKGPKTPTPNQPIYPLGTFMKKTHQPIRPTAAGGFFRSSGCPPSTPLVAAGSRAGPAASQPGLRARLADGLRCRAATAALGVGRTDGGGVGLCQAYWRGGAVGGLGAGDRVCFLVSCFCPLFVVTLLLFKLPLRGRAKT